ncbi:hypothetical protein [Streptomyces sp. AS02]|uniref:hypothetical protein n=1 Tax=Streptomyces sp. AS02 TaxID=2938946 RepID=UPI00201FDDFD|nr:hypothetical protein [Streptomyces sp. AS02]MCL8016900.1 hypothetical protein [Streptomyces sp. AS02]
MTPAKSTEGDGTGLPVITGPAIHYTSSPDNLGMQTVQRIDLDAPGDPRERAICRALLHHALALLDASEPARRAPGMQTGRP